MNFLILSPVESDVFYSSNAASIVLLLTTNGRSILFTGDIDESKIVQINKLCVGRIDVIELPHHGQWSKESQALIDSLLPRAVIQSTNRARHAMDIWKIPIQTTRFVTAIDGNITTTICKDGRLSISGSNDPVTMPTCVFPKP
jgi:beta-lactamase superfamily II metal-dependent hydrolase